MFRGPVGGILAIAGCTAFAALLIAGAMHSFDLAAWSVRLARRLHLLPPLAPVPDGAPLEQIVQDLRRLHPQARRPSRGTTHAKHLGLMAAYDDVLLDACRAVDVPTSLSSLPEGIERESERLRVEFELERAGIPFRATS